MSQAAVERMQNIDDAHLDGRGEVEQWMDGWIDQVFVARGCRRYDMFLSSALTSVCLLNRYDRQLFHLLPTRSSLLRFLIPASGHALFLQLKNHNPAILCSVHFTSFPLNPIDCHPQDLFSHIQTLLAIKLSTTSARCAAMKSFLISTVFVPAAMAMAQRQPPAALASGPVAADGEDTCHDCMQKYVDCTKVTKLRHLTFAHPCSLMCHLEMHWQCRLQRRLPRSRLQGDA